MRICSLFFVLLSASITANSQVTESAQFLDIFKTLRTPHNQPIKCDIYDDVQKRILFEYGAVYVSKNSALPQNCLFSNETQVKEFAGQFTKPENKFEFGDFYLQPQARKSLEFVFKQLGGYKNVARNWNQTTSREKSRYKDLNDDWAFRTYGQTLFNWGYCQSTTGTCEGVINLSEVEDLLNDDDEKVKPKIFGLAVPGSSQHHLGLAIDVNNVGNKKINGRFCGEKCERALERNGWYRTVPFDPYHFTYLGFLEFELPGRGLKKVSCGRFDYWVPNVSVKIYPGYKFIRNPKSGCKDVN